MVISNNSNCTDMFQHLIENADFYASIEDFLAKVQYYENIIRSMPPAEERFDIQLAILSLKIQRVGTGLDSQCASAQLNEISKYISSDQLLEFKYKLVRGQYCLIVEEDFLSAKLLFEELIEKLRESEHHLLYALVSKSLSVAYMMLGDISSAEEFAQDAVATFRRFGSRLLYSHSLNIYSILKKKACQYYESEKLLKKSLKLFQDINASDGEASCYNNLGLIKMKTGEWDDADYYFNRAKNLKNSYHLTVVASLKQKLNLEHLHVLKRNFERADKELNELLKAFSNEKILKLKTLTLEFLGELYCEIGEYKKAQEHLDQAEEVAMQCAPESDVMTEIKRRKATLFLARGEVDKAKAEAFECANLSKRISDKHEMGAVLRVLGEIYIALKEPRKAVSAFEASINTLKKIHECYELMRGCISYGEHLVSCGSKEAEIYLLEAKQLCCKLKLDYFMSKIILLMGKYEMRNDNYTEARDCLRGAETLSENLQKCDRKRIKKAIKEFYEELENKVLRVSMDSAQKLKALGRIYEEARFPLEEVRPELALEVVRNVGAESLFLVKRENRGYSIPLKYNISVKEAKRITRVLSLKSRGNLIRRNRDPKIHDIGDNKVVVCIPGQSDTGYLLCTVVDSPQDFTPRQFEFLFASVEVMEHLAEEYANQQPAAKETSEFIEENTRIISHPGGSFKETITIDPDMIKIIRLAERASKTDAPILLEGETGVGKELFARAIHASSKRACGEFVALNAGGVPVNFLESQLFGHVKGAFTDARMDRVGLIEETSGGSIFFDEIGEMHEELQVKLLRILESGEFRRLGENKLRYANVRVISATNKNLEEMVENGRFRKDLYYRLATVRFRIPPLRFRKGDIELLVRHFLKEFLKRVGREDRHIDIDMKALEAFELYDWPGNIRELQNEIMRVISLIGEGEVIRFGMLSDTIKSYFKKHGDKGLLEKNVERYERRLILKALEDNDWNRNRTAEQIGIPRTTLIGKMKRLNIVS